MTFFSLTDLKTQGVNNRNANGEPFPADIVQKVWEKGQPLAGEDPNRVRRDRCGAIIHREKFGQSSEALSGGWEIDHIKPLAMGGTDEFPNLQPLQWENNRHKGNAHPSWMCTVEGGKELNKYIGQ